MIQVWSWPTPNGHKVHIALEELGLPYQIVPVNRTHRVQSRPLHGGMMFLNRR